MRIILLKSQSREIENKDELVKTTKQYYQKFIVPEILPSLRRRKRLITNVNSEIMSDSAMNEIDRTIREMKRNRADEEGRVLMELIKEGRKKLGSIHKNLI